MTSKRCLIGIALIALTSPVWADQSSQSNQAIPSGQVTQSTPSNLGWQGWGLRVGVTDDADQVVGGAHFNLGELMNNLRFQPDVQLGSGDDLTTVYGTAPLYYRFGTSSNVTPYAGGGVALGYVDRDLPASSSGDDTDFEFGAKATGGIEWLRKGGEAFFLELSLGFGDVHDAQIVAAWTF